MAESLAEAGFHTLRLDYDGTGESVGDDGDPGRVQAWISSIHEAIEALRDRAGVASIGVVGLRMGATLAAAAAADRRIDNLVLWEPCASGTGYVWEMEVFAAATRKALTGRAAQTAPDLGIEAGGYLLTPQTVADLSALELEKSVIAGTPRVLLIRRDDRPTPRGLAEHLEALGCPTSEVRLPGYREMMVYPLRSKPPVATFEHIVAWASEGDEGAAALPAGRPVLASATHHEGITQHALRFGPDERLFGVVTELEGGEPDGAAIVLLSGGIVPRIAVNRMYFGLARRLAGEGHRVLRLDISGIGESFPAPGEAVNNAYAGAFASDVRSAVEVAVGDEPGRPVWLVGLCSGAYGAFQHALADERVVGATLINPIEYYPRHGLAFANDQNGDGSSAGNGVSVKRLHEWAGARLPQITDRLGWRRRRLLNDIRMLIGRGVGVDIAFSEGDPGREVLSSALGTSLADLERDGFRLSVYQQTDHTFNQLAPRALLLDWIVEGMTQRFDRIRQGAS